MKEQRAWQAQKTVKHYGWEVFHVSDLIPTDYGGAFVESSAFLCLILGAHAPL